MLKKKKKKCPKCNDVKNSNEFYENKGRFSSYCKNCLKQTSKENIEKRKQYRIDNIDKIKTQKKKWRDENKHHIKLKKKLWAEENKDKIKQNYNKWKNENKEYLKAYHKQWAEENRNHLKEYQKNWREENKDYIKKYNKQNPHIITNARIKRQNKINDRITKDEWFEIMFLYDFKCFYCDLILNNNYTLDHIIPISKGGKHCFDNLIPACRSCNSSKTNKIFPIWDGIKNLSKDKKLHIVNKIKINDFSNVNKISMLEIEGFLKTIEI